MTSHAEDTLVYVYGALRAPARPRFGSGWPGVPGAGSPRAVAAGRNLWLLAADVPAAAFTSEAAGEGMGDVEWIARCAAAHHDVIARAMRRWTIVPFRPFSLFQTDARAVAEVARRRRAIDRAIARVAGCREWVVRAAIDPAAAAAAAPPRAASGTAYLMGRAAARRQAGRVPAGAARLAGGLASAVGAHARAAVRRQASAGDGVLLDLALLVRRDREARVRAAIRGWKPRLAAQGCRVWQTGPWPPYSFVALESGGKARRPRG